MTQKLAYLLIAGQKIPVLVDTGKRGVYICKRSTQVKESDTLLDWVSQFLSRPENRRMLKALDDGKTLYL